MTDRPSPPSGDGSRADRTGARGASVLRRALTLADGALDAIERGEPLAGTSRARRALAMIRDGTRAGDDMERVAEVRAAAWRALGTAQRTLARYPQALVSFGHALEAATAAFGPGSVEAATIHNDIGMTHRFAGRFAESAAAYGMALALLEALPDAEADDLASIWHNLGGLAYVQGDHETAEPLARRAIEVRAAALGPDHAATLLDRSAHAPILDALGRTGEAEAALRAVMGPLVAALGEHHPEVAVARNNLAAIVQRRGDLGEAERLYREVLAAREARLGAASPALAVPLSNLGTVLRAQGRPDEARRLYERALRLLDGAVAVNHPTLRTVRGNLERLGSASTP